ncbi:MULTISPECIES: Yip1 family protein [Marinifilum]|uniref:Yip1-like protein n=1 Tax=Marinifilum flexuosum TaxID=1117708 RepID=A0A419WWT6_9BACT|nr:MULTISPECIES: Yip1 family protein [Marinifilum]MCY1635611.1 YIP1 family protein [Marinifilum sp. D737]RKD99921.1 Yip1-like protein [Marinifilum flexuosum]
MTILATYKHTFRLLISPEKEWISILDHVNIKSSKLLFILIIPLALIMSACNFLGFVIFEKDSTDHIDMFLFSSITTFVLSIASIYISSIVVRPFAVLPTKKERFERAYILVAFSYTPGFIFNSIAFLFPIINYLTIFGLYSFYILYKGITPILNVPDRRRSGYFTFILIGLLSIYAVLGALFIGTANFLGF